MGKIIFITGGARSGKSKFAETLLQNSSDVIYIATAVPLDDEMKRRIEIHKQRRNKNWITVEAYNNLPDKLDAVIRNKKDITFNNIVLDCITNMINNLMIIDRDVKWDDIDYATVENIEKEITDKIMDFLIYIENFKGSIIIVSNEVGMGIVPDTPLCRSFRDIAGRVNQIIAEKADEVYLLSSGIPMKIKG